MTGARVTKDRTKHERIISVEGAPRVDAGYPRGEYQLEPREITLQWYDQEKPALIHVAGPRVLKNGTLGQYRSTAYTWGETPRHHPIAPEWITNLIHGADCVQAVDQYAKDTLGEAWAPHSEPIHTPKDLML
jgi:hypothetical protein